MNLSSGPYLDSIYGPGKNKKGLRTCVKCADLHHRDWLSIETFCSVQLFRLRTAKSLTRMRLGHVGWSGLSLPAYARRHGLA